MSKSRCDTRNLMACLGDASRYRIVARLRAGPAFVTEIAVSVGISQSCTTRHLQALGRAGVVKGERDGKKVIYRLRLEHLPVAELVRWAVARAPGLTRGDGPKTGPAPRPAPQALPRPVTVERKPGPSQAPGGVDGGAPAWERPLSADIEDFLL